MTAEPMTGLAERVALALREFERMAARARERAKARAFEEAAARLREWRYYPLLWEGNYTCEVCDEYDWISTQGPDRSGFPLCAPNECRRCGNTVWPFLLAAAGTAQMEAR